MSTIRVGDVESLWLYIIMRPLQASLSYRRGIYQWSEVFNVLNDKAIEEVNVRISKTTEVEVLVYRLGLLPYLLETSFNLNLGVFDSWRKKTMGSVVPANSCGMGGIVVAALWCLVSC